MIHSFVGSRAGLKSAEKCGRKYRLIANIFFTTLTMNISAEHPLQQRSISSGTSREEIKVPQCASTYSASLALWKVPFFADFCHLCRWRKSYHGAKASTQHGTLKGQTMFYQSASKKTRRFNDCCAIDRKKSPLSIFFQVEPRVNPFSTCSALPRVSSAYCTRTLPIKI